MSQAVPLEISESVPAQTESCATYVPPNGAVIIVREFHAAGAFAKSAVVKVVWDMGGAGEEVLWSEKGSGVKDIGQARVGDGTKKLALCLDNGDTVPLYMSGSVDVRVHL